MLDFHPSSKRKYTNFASQSSRFFGYSLRYAIPLPSINLLGSGNVATRLGLSLHKKGYPVRSVYSPTLAHAETLAARLPDAAPLDDPNALPEADIWIFSVKDDALTALVERMAARHTARSLFIHTAGSVGIDVFGATAHPAGVLYPMQTISKDRDIRFKDVPLFIEGNNPEAASAVATLARSLSDRVRPLSSEDRRKLHLAAVFACNFANHCYALAGELMESAGLAPDLLLPLIDETAKKVHRLPAAAAQTGPAARNDRSVMNRHLDALADRPLFEEIYRLMSRSILAMKNKPQ